MTPAAIPSALEVARFAPWIAPWIGGAFILGMLLKRWEPFRKMALAHEASENARLTTRIATLETLLTSETNRLEARLDEERANHEAEMQIMRHRLNNETASLDALLMLLETAPEKVASSVTLIKDLRACREEAIALEKAELARLKITNATRRVEAAQDIQSKREALA